MLEEALSLVNRIDPQQVPWLPYGLIEGTQFRVLKVDPRNNIVVLNFRMGPRTVTQKHDHHCTALAYTLGGQWMYGDQVFEKGDLAFEQPGEIHQPITRDHGAELLTIMIGGRGNPRLLQNYEEDGSTYILGTRFFSAVERITPQQLAAVDLQSLLDPAG